MGRQLAKNRSKSVLERLITKNLTGLVTQFLNRKKQLKSIANMGYRNNPPNKIWQYPRVEVYSTPLSPIAYYMEDKVLANDIELLLEDATMDEFIALYKNYNHNYFFKLGYKNAQFFSNGPVKKAQLLLVQEQFFTDFKEGAYYCKKASLNLVSYLVKDHYPNDTTFNKAKTYFDEWITRYFIEGRQLVSFQFYQNIKQATIFKTIYS